MSTEVVVTEATLNEIKYHDLKAELDKHGLGSCWGNGKKKIDIIKDAISKLALVKEMQEKGIAQEDIDKTLEEKNQEVADKKAEKEALEQKAAEEKAKEKEEEEKENVTKPETKEVDVNRLYRSLSLTRANIKGGPITHTPQLRVREQTLLDLLKEAGEIVD